MFSAKHSPLLKTGKIGELAAIQYLKDRHYKIIATNYWKPWGEIDIIAESKDATIVFVEVKAGEYKSENAAKIAAFSPEDHMNKRKIKNLKKVCQEFANKNSHLINEEKNWQIDLITVKIIQNSELTEEKKNYIIKHYPNIVSF